MNQHTLPALAKQRTAELRDVAAASRRPDPDRAVRPSLRVRTGWTLVDLGLRLAAPPAPALARKPRAASSC